MTEAALEIHWQRVRRHSPRDWGREWALECVHSPIPPLVIGPGVPARGRGRTPGPPPSGERAGGSRCQEKEAPVTLECLLSLVVPCRPHARRQHPKIPHQRLPEEAAP